MQPVLCFKDKPGPSFLSHSRFCLAGRNASFHQDFSVISHPPSLLISTISSPPRPPSRSEAESSISWSSRIHLIMAAFPHLLPLNHSLHLYFSGRLIHLYMSHYLPRCLPSLSHSSILLASFLIVFVCATPRFKFPHAVISSGATFTCVIFPS